MTFNIIFAAYLVVVLSSMFYMTYVHPRKSKNTQRTFCYCPNCHHEMIGDGKSFVEDTDLVKFDCSKCNNKSEWNFDIAPVALVVRSDNGYTDLKDVHH